MAKKKGNTGPFWRFLLVVYAAVMLWLLFGRENGWVEGVAYKQQLRQNCNLVPLYTIKNYCHILQHPTSRELQIHCFINLFGNVLLFIPAGYLLPKVWKRLRNFFRFFALCLGLIFLVEAVQLFSLLGSFDVDDIILNLAGMTLGFLYRAIRRKG